MTHTPSPLQRWGAFCALAAGITFIVPLLFAFVILPAEGSGASHALYPEDFLPWMAAQGRARQAFWWATAIPFLLAAFGVPGALKRRQQAATPVAAAVTARAGTLGLLVCGVASLALVGGEMPLARAYVAAGAEASVEVQQSIVAVYTWQRIAVGLLFDFFGFLMVGVWTLGASLAGLRAGSLPKALSWFGVATGTLCFAFAFGYVLHLDWLGEFGLGSLAFLAVPAWLVWVGLMLWQHGA